MPLLALRLAAAWKHLCRFPIWSGAFALIKFGASLPYCAARLAKVRQVWEIVPWSPISSEIARPSRLVISPLGATLSPMWSSLFVRLLKRRNFLVALVAVALLVPASLATARAETPEPASPAAPAPAAEAPESGAATEAPKAPPADAAPEAGETPKAPPADAAPEASETPKKNLRVVYL